MLAEYWPAMSQENVEMVQAALAAYFRSDESTLRELTSADLVVTTRPDQPDVRDHRGFDGLIDVLGEWINMWDDFVFEVSRVWDVEDHVFIAARQRGRGKGSGAPIDDAVTFVFTVREDQVARLQMFGAEREALEAVGLAGG
jgi:ketosteroid isomerase-like protein